MAKEGDKFLTNKRSEAPKLLDADVPSSKRVATSADFSSQEEEAPQAVGAADNITETPVEADPATSDGPDPYEMSPSDLEDVEEPKKEGHIQFAYKTLYMGDTTGLKKAMDAKAKKIDALGVGYDYLFEKIKESQIGLQRHPKSLVYLYWCNGGVASMAVGIRMKDHLKLQGENCK